MISAGKPPLLPSCFTPSPSNPHGLFCGQLPERTPHQGMPLVAPTGRDCDWDLLVACQALCDPAGLCPALLLLPELSDSCRSRISALLPLRFLLPVLPFSMPAPPGSLCGRASSLCSGALFWLWRLHCGHAWSLIHAARPVRSRTAPALLPVGPFPRTLSSWRQALCQMDGSVAAQWAPWECSEKLSSGVLLRAWVCNGCWAIFKRRKYHGLISHLWELSLAFWFSSYVYILCHESGFESLFSFSQMPTCRVLPLLPLLPPRISDDSLKVYPGCLLSRRGGGR